MTELASTELKRGVISLAAVWLRAFPGARWVVLEASAQTEV